MLHGILLIALFSCAAFYIGDISVIKKLSLSPLIIGIVLGMLYANSLRNRLPATWVPGILFCSKQLLRAGIVLYGFNLTFQDIVKVGFPAILIDAVIVTVTIYGGIWVGRLLKMDKGVALLFESEDGEHWSCLHRLETKEPFGYMWECPDVFQVDGYTVLSISPQGVKADGLKYNNVYQSVTTFLDGDFREAVVREDFRELDAGFDFYAPQSFQAEDGRRIQIGWMGMPDVDAYYTNPSVEDGWQHTLTLPRELSVRDGVLCQKPVRELDDWWNFFIPFVNTYSDVPGDCFEVAASGTGGEFRLVLAGGLELSWKEEEGIFWMSFTDQRLGAGRARRGRAVEKLTDLRVIVDISCVEVFLNGGREVFSTRFYPDREEIGVELRASGFDGRICLHREGT